MGDRTRLCNYTNTPNDQFIAKPITTPVVGLNSINIAENVPLTLEDTLNELLNILNICCLLCLISWL